MHTTIRLASLTLLALALGGCGDDMGLHDTGPNDASPGDASPGDATPGDASPGDASPGDAGERPLDAAPFDAAPFDAAPFDAAPPDAGQDASPADAGQDDAGPDATAGEPDWPDTDLPPPAWVDLDVGPLGSCEALVACGGDIEGVWDVDGGCFEVDIESAIDRCPGAAVTRRQGRARGRVVFGSDGTAHRVAESVVESDIHFPAVCAAFFSCAMLETAMRSVVSDATCRTESAGNCHCTASQTVAIDDRDTYRTEANQIVGGVSGKRWDYCVDGTSLRYEDRSSIGPREPGAVSLRRR